MTSTSELILEWDRRRPRTQQRTIGISDLGTCRRRVGYKLAATEPVNAIGSVQAAMGSAVHQILGEILVELGKAESSEQEVTFAGIVGHYDRIEGDMLIDVKTTSSRWCEHIRLHGPEHSHKWQTTVYAAALITAGVPIKRTRIDYLERDTGDEYNWPSLEGRPFDIREVKEAMDWLKLVRDTPLEMLPRDYMPDTTMCRKCPFGGDDGGICWAGHVPGHGLASVLYVENPDAGMWAEELWAAKEQGKEAEEAEKKARAALMALVEPGGRTAKCGDRFLRLTTNNQLRFVSGPRKSELTL